MNPNVKILKAELLWSRHCPFTCAGCAMYDNSIAQINDLTELPKWQRGMDNLKSIGCQFLAIYGAEPLTRMKALPELIAYQRSIGLYQTVITALNAPKHIKRLVDAGLDSLTVSYDIKTSDEDRATKMDNGACLLDTLSHIPDRACVVTLSSENEEHFISAAREVLGKGYWLLFDVMHPGMEGDHAKLSKCTGSGMEPSVEGVRRICGQLIKWKRDGLRVHASEPYLSYLAQHYNGDVRKTWHCGDHAALGWITIDHNGDIFPCDDWQVPYPDGKIWDDINWDHFYDWRMEAVKPCAGCSWNTHWDAVVLTERDEVGTYIHAISPLAVVAQ